MTYTITSISERAQVVFDKADNVARDLGLDKAFPTLSMLSHMARSEMTNTSEVEGIPLFAGFSGFAMAHADHSEAFTPSAGGGNSGRGSSGRA